MGGLFDFRLWTKQDLERVAKLLLRYLQGTFPIHCLDVAHATLTESGLGSFICPQGPTLLVGTGRS